MTIDEAIRRCEEVAERYDRVEDSHAGDGLKQECIQCAADHRQLAEWLTKLKEAKGIIRVCNRMLGHLLECEIENTSTRHEVETLLKSITEYLSGGSENAE